MLKLSDFDYILPPEKIAKVPVVPRDSSKLLVLERDTEKITDTVFHTITNYLRAGDVLVRNNTKVIPARIFGQKKTGGKIEVLLTKKIAHSPTTETWECLTRPGIKPNQVITFGNSLSAICLTANKNEYTRILEFNQMGPTFFETLERIGITPLPPYIANTTHDTDDIRKKYQTVYAKYEGSAAAPTAGLHFTSELETKIREAGVLIADVTLHVGLGTFLPVKSENVLDHHMHSEWYEITNETAEVIQNAKRMGNRVIAVGTTSCRVLESASTLKQGLFSLSAESKETDIYIYPGYKFKCIDGLITNYHLPKSTLLMLISAFVSSPNTRFEFTNFLASPAGKAYTHAIEHNYRFYSFGDSMFII